MPELKLFFAPGTCARVPLVTLEELGVPYTWQLVRFMKGEHKSPEYKRNNPKGKVPALLVDGEALTENVAILLHLNHLFPEAGLLPAPENTLDYHRQVADLCFCSATLHPLVTRIRMPHFVAGMELARKVYNAACKAMDEYFQLVEDRLQNQDWWYDNSWTAMDAYLYWVFWRVEGAKYDVSRYPRYVAHARRMEQRPSVQRADEVETEANHQLEAEGLKFVPPDLPAE